MLKERKTKMEELLEKINNSSLEMYLVAGKILLKAFDIQEEDQMQKLCNLSEKLQNISLALKSIWQELKE